MKNTNLEPWLSMNEISRHLGITRDTVLTWIEERGLPGVRIGRTWRFKASEVDAWVRATSERQLLTAEEYNGLSRIASATKMDCWFWIEQKNGVDFIRDLETGAFMDFTVGLSQLAEGIIDPLPKLGLTPNEVTAVERLFKRHGIELQFK